MFSGGPLITERVVRELLWAEREFSGDVSLLPNQEHNLEGNGELENENNSHGREKTSFFQI